MAEKFDPRYDPAFQPGFDPSRHGSTAAPDAPRAESGLPVARPIAEPDAVPMGPATVSEAEDEAPASGNPFERLLWFVSAALVIGGVMFTFWANSITTFYQGPPDQIPWQDVLRQLSWTLSSPMITIGLGAAVGLLFRRAARWKPSAQ